MPRSFKGRGEDGTHLILRLHVKLAREELVLPELHKPNWHQACFKSLILLVQTPTQVCDVGYVCGSSLQHQDQKLCSPKLATPSMVAPLLYCVTLQQGKTSPLC